MKQANHVFEKVTKYAIRKLSVGVGPVAIGTFLLAGGLFVSKPVSADQVTSDASVHMAYVTENELTAEEQKQVVHAIPKEFIGAVIGPGGKIIQQMQEVATRSVALPRNARRFSCGASLLS